MAGAGDGVRDIVKLEIEEHVEAALHQLPDQLRSGAREQLLADLEPAGTGFDTFDQCQCGLCIRVVQRDDDAGTGYIVFVHVFLSMLVHCNESKGNLIATNNRSLSPRERDRVRGSIKQPDHIPSPQPSP